jgi:glycine cleavage system aminomethyltransferase T
MAGQVTSSYASPTLGRSIVLALVKASRLNREELLDSWKGRNE